MSFIRSFDVAQRQKLTSGNNSELFEQLKKDIFCDDPQKSVFPTIRKNELHFYYKGGCLFKFAQGRFQRDESYERFDKNTDGLSFYEKAKKENENKFTSLCGEATERNLLSALSFSAFRADRNNDVVVLDIEVNLNGNTGRGKKCDLVFLNTKTSQIMFVEGKIFSDRRVNVKVGYVPEVIQQVGIYTQAIAEQRENIVGQYSAHISVLNDLFGTSFVPPKSLIEPAKLLVYNEPIELNDNGRYSVEQIRFALGVNNVVFYKTGVAPTTDEIWSALCK